MIQAQYSRIAQKLYRLRWRFIYNDGKPDVFGVWDESSPHKANKASYQSKVNLASAVIQGECRFTGKIINIVEIPGHELRHVRCEAWAPLSMGIKTEASNKIKLLPRLHMMFFQTDDKIIGVTVDGNIVGSKINDTDKFKSFEHSAGA